MDPVAALQKTLRDCTTNSACSRCNQCDGRQVVRTLLNFVVNAQASLGHFTRKRAMNAAYHKVSRQLLGCQRMNTIRDKGMSWQFAPSNVTNSSTMQY